MKVYRCDVCGDAVESESRLNAFHRMRGPGRSDLSKPGIDYCQSCGEKWITPVSLRTHNEIYDVLAAKGVKAP